jgi:ubiquinone/menaquinone biosynthesis C-methylase UbiE
LPKKIGSVEHGRSSMSNAEVAATPRSQYVDFWNTVLVPKFVRWRHILVGGLTLHSTMVFPSLAVRKGDAVVDAGCGFGDTAIQLARLVGPTGSVLAIDCCDGFLEYGRQDAKAAGVNNVTFLRRRCCHSRYRHLRFAQRSY